jgi:hypothetical protein
MAMRKLIAIALIGLMVVAGGLGVWQHRIKRKAVLIAAVVSVLVLLITGIGCQSSEGSGKVEIADPYCTYDGFFHFTLRNREDANTSVNYRWMLNDPMSDDPVHEGSGKATLEALEDKEIIIDVSGGDYDARFYVMNIYVYHEGGQVAYYSGQKSTYEWDYSTLPPVPRTGDGLHTFLDFNIFISRAGDSYKLEIDDVFWAPPERNPDLSLANIVVELNEFSDHGFKATLKDIQDDDSGPPYAMKFYDNDNNGELSSGDYIMVNITARGKEVSFEHKEDPYLIIKARDTIEEEDKDSIQVHNIWHEKLDQNAIEIYVEVTSNSVLHSR